MDFADKPANKLHKSKLIDSQTKINFMVYGLKNHGLLFKFNLNRQFNPYLLQLLLIN